MFFILCAINEIKSETERELIMSLFNTYGCRVKAYAYFILKNDKDAEDAVGNVFEKIIKYRHKFVNIDGDETKRLIVIYCRSICFDMLDERKKRKLVSLSEKIIGDDGEEYFAEIPDDNTDVLGEVVDRVTVERLKSAINSLPMPAREIVLLKYFDHAKNIEIADMLGLNASTVGTILHRSLAKLRKEMEEYYGDEY